MKTRLMLILVLAGAAPVVSGCSSAGYPSTEKRIENIDETIKKNNLTGEPNPDRDARFKMSTGQGN